MLWRLPVSVRSLYIANCRSYSYSSKAVADPLKILFCGSDEFSIASLEAVHAAKLEEPQLVESIDVVHRPGKRTGRGLKVVRDVPIKHFAKDDLGLTTHEIDTFTGWTPPVPYNLVIAVSFGLFVPPRILCAAKYGGLNVHPSLLPDLRGPAPIHHTLLKKRKMTGVTIQTLHPKHFDHGTIIAQTPPPGLPLDVVPELTPAKLTSVLGKAGAKMLVDVLKNQAFLHPLRDHGWYGSTDNPIDHAEKITKQHRFVDHDNSIGEDVDRRNRVLGNLWCTLPNGKRVILDDIRLSNFPKPSRQEDDYQGKPGLMINANDDLVLRTGDGCELKIHACTVEAGRRGEGGETVKSALKKT
ncbi:formyl transferase [Lophiotrema nucula]|uniref:methionyl-tRNA formyltransferase n=1 Tax=Lophiotrema nucula TaxID=690887 RepID=A0A6A5ZFC6_9PLEO|nr:formyl transferase [Lophiotrema nucula]